MNLVIRSALAAFTNQYEVYWCAFNLRMSDKKELINDQANEQPASIEIVTVGVKNSNAQIVQKEPKQDVAPPPQPQPEDEAQNQPDPPVSHSHLGDKNDEEKIRQHVQDMLHQIEAEQSPEAEEESQQSNVSNSSPSDKSEKSEKKDGHKSNYESNDQRKEDLPTSRRCFNKLCSSKKIYKKIRSRVQQNKYRFFCKNCYENYSGNFFCEFCEQIYSINCQNEDDDKWIGCDHCDRWNHIECQQKHRGKAVNDLKDKNCLYQCLACTQKSKNNNEKSKKPQKEAEEKIITKQKIQINKDQRTPIFHKKIQNFPNLEYFLQNYSFRLWMNEGQIRQDLQHLRSVCLKTPQEDNSKNKFKKVKTD